MARKSINFGFVLKSALLICAVGFIPSMIVTGVFTDAARLAVSTGHADGDRPCPPGLIGDWHGTDIHTDFSYQTTFTATFATGANDNICRGESSDRMSTPGARADAASWPAVLRLKADAADKARQITFIKRFTGVHRNYPVIIYSGKISPDNATIDGSWRIPTFGEESESSGTFKMTRTAN